MASGAAEFAEQLAGEARTEAGRQRERNPAYVLAGFHFPRGKPVETTDFAQRVSILGTT